MTRDALPILPTGAVLVQRALEARPATESELEETRRMIEEREK